MYSIMARENRIDFSVLNVNRSGNRESAFAFLAGSE